MQNACLDYVDPTKTKSESGDDNQSPSFSLNINILFRLYASFGAGSRASDVFVDRKVGQYGLNEKRFITFGVAHGLIRRLHHFPVRVRRVEEVPDGEVLNNKTLLDQLEEHDLLNGKWCVDHLCCVSHQPSRKIMEALIESSKYETILRAK
eukprot:gb/GECG01015321.1/.p1 GENE.gb/GECG01015321.1/~~gb/GECG01015321.1/.p1  ORF type:complete len:151 (+),score=14.35 gb/GECG01015321.1/:1-453(+)